MKQETGSEIVQSAAFAAYMFSAMAGMASCAVPARAVAGGTNVQGTLPFEGVASLHAARTSQRDVPTALNTYFAADRKTGEADTVKTWRTN